MCETFTCIGNIGQRAIEKEDGFLGKDGFVYPSVWEDISLFCGYISSFIFFLRKKGKRKVGISERK